MLTAESNNPLADQTLDPETTALLVIDVLGDVTDHPASEVLVPAYAQAARLAECCRENEIPVIFTNDAHLPGIDRELRLWGDHGLAGSEEAQVAAVMKLSDEDYIIEKRRYSAFFQTGLRLLLDELGARTLILCGWDTNICVRHTAADAFFNNFDLIVASDATATFLVGDQAQGLEEMKVCYGARIATTDEIIAMIEGER